MEDWKPISYSSASSSSSSSSSLPSIVSELPELFGVGTPQGSSSGLFFDSVFSLESNTGVKREVQVSEASISLKMQQPECGIQHTKKPSAATLFSDGISQITAKDGQSIPNKDGSSDCKSELVEHTLLSSSLHYGGRDDHMEPSSTQAYSGTSNIFGKSSREDVSEGGSPRGDWWQGSLYY